MALSLSTKRRGSEEGFTLIETLASIGILSVGLLAMAGLMSRTTTSSSQSRYMSTASVMATQKLEELNRYPASDPMVNVTGTAGSLTGDVSAGGINFYDDVYISGVGGSITQVTSDSSGNYLTVSQKPDGTISVSAPSASAPAVPAQTLQFHRRWTIEKDAPVTGARRVTVFVQLVNPPVVNSVTFQISMVRP